MSQQAGKAVSKWTAKIGDLIVGGQPPFDDIGGHFGTPSLIWKTAPCLQVPWLMVTVRNSSVSPVCHLKMMHLDAGIPK